MVDSPTFGWILVGNIVCAGVSIGFSAAAFSASSRDFPSNDASFQTVNTHLASIEGDFAAQSCFLTYTASPWQLTEETMREYINDADWTIGVPKYSSRRKACVCDESDASNPVESEKGFTPVWIAPGDLIDHTTTGGILEGHSLPTKFVSEHKHDYDPDHHVKICLEQDRIAALWNSDPPRCHSQKTDGTVDRIYTGWDGDLFCAGSSANSLPSAPPSAPPLAKMTQTDLVGVPTCDAPYITNDETNYFFSFYKAFYLTNSTFWYDSDYYTLEAAGSLSAGGSSNGDNCQAAPNSVPNYVFHNMIDASMPDGSKLSSTTPVRLLPDLHFNMTNGPNTFSCSGDCFAVKIGDYQDCFLVGGDVINARSGYTNTYILCKHIANLMSGSLYNITDFDGNTFTHQMQYN